MRGFFARRKARQTAEGATVHGPLAQINGVGGDVHVTLGAVPPPPEAPEIESARAAYATRVRQRYGGLDLEVLTPLQEQGERPLVLRLRDVFVAQSVRADPPPVELPQELLRRLMDPAEADSSTGRAVTRRPGRRRRSACATNRTRTSRRRSWRA
ncbi:hypothetical protein AB0B30_26570 [Streptomyces narbonensis]|uniref:Uncharacterized protein n=1 Tax=Streptomyces narbonensis TaxID=67333 RepID=A0ABV3CK67_9ACTN